jgi:hypothetical protein
MVVSPRKCVQIEDVKITKEENEEHCREEHKSLLQHLASAPLPDGDQTFTQMRVNLMPDRRCVIATLCNQSRLS